MSGEPSPAAQQACQLTHKPLAERHIQANAYKNIKTCCNNTEKHNNPNAINSNGDIKLLHMPAALLR
jgi:hypothetical protein